MISSGILLLLCQSVDSQWENDIAIREILKNQPLKINDLQWIKVLNVECLVIHTNTGDMYIFKSSDSKEDWDDNYKFFPVKVHPNDRSCCFVCGSSNVHTGFNKQCMFLLPELKTQIRSKKAIFTGFSLGGALATLCAYYMEYTSRELVSFGSPKVGNGEFVRQLEPKLKRNERWVYRKDYITRLPPGKYYKHTGTLNVLGYSKILHKTNDGPFFYCNSSYYNDHDITKYIECMESFV